MEYPCHLLFADGSSLGNPGPSGWGTVLVLGNTRVIELGGAKAVSTNNEMELTAVRAGFKALTEKAGDVTVYTDSSYVINGITKWVHGWQKNGWMTKAKTPVEHQALWQEIISLVGERKGVITWTHVPGHSGVAGNERVDAIATGFSEGAKPMLYDGTLNEYTIDIMNTTIDRSLYDAREKGKSRAKIKAYSYVSLVDGHVMVHQTWKECEARVKGKSGVRYRKVASKEEEEQLVHEWSKGK